MKKRLIFNIISISIAYFLGYLIFSPLYKLNSVYINYGLSPYDICAKQPNLWLYLKIAFIISCSINIIIITNIIYSKFFINSKYTSKFSFQKQSNIFNNNTEFISKQNDLELLIGLDTKKNPIYIPEKGLYQNMIITGTIGSGKTSSAMYPFTSQLISYKNTDENEKIGMLILDVKGNYQYQVKKYCEKYERADDLIVIELGGEFKYNPLDKPNLKASVLANRLKTILLLFSENNSESYWLDKAEQILEQAIKICRLYNNNYVNFSEIHKLVTDTTYYYSKVEYLKNQFILNAFSQKDCYDMLTALNFFEKEFLSLDQRTLSILKSEITRMTNCFISDYDVLHTFCPEKDEENFNSLSQILNEGKIVVLNMNISEYKNLSKIIAAYLKLDFQTEVLSTLAKNSIKRTVAFISDEYHEYVTATDADFFAQSREAKCINIVATQSYTSLLKTLNSESAVKVIIQNLINKLWLRTDDSFTIEEAQKQIGKEDKEKISTSISENAKETFFNYLTNSLNSKNSSITETLNSVVQHDFIFDTNHFTQELNTFNCIGFLSTGNSILRPQKIELIPFFKENVLIR